MAAACIKITLLGKNRFNISLYQLLQAYELQLEAPSNTPTGTVSLIYTMRSTSAPHNPK